MSRPRPLARRAAFTDTGAYFALGVTRDTNHPAARAIGEQLVTERRHLYTTNFISAETHVLYLNRVGRADALRATNLQLVAQIWSFNGDKCHSPLVVQNARSIR